MVTYESAGQKQNAKRRKTTPRSTTPWSESHAQICQHRGISEWWTSRLPAASTQETWPMLKALTARELEILDLEYSVNFPEKTARLIQVGQSFGRGKARLESCNTIARTMRCYITSHCRLVRGLEALHMQGIHYGHRHSELATGRFNDIKLMSLAGNAFHTWCCAASLLSLLILLSELHAKHQRLLCERSVQKVAAAKSPSAPFRAHRRSTALEEGHYGGTR